ncbi:uncharacterized [Tachysurus ichikawai]
MRLSSCCSILVLATAIAQEDVEKDGKAPKHDPPRSMASSLLTSRWISNGLSLAYTLTHRSDLAGSNSGTGVSLPEHFCDGVGAICEPSV